MIVGQPRPCANGCGALVEWGVDRARRVGLIECVGRFVHVCPKGLTGAYLTCACGRRIHTYRHGFVEDAETGLPHDCAGDRRAAPPRSRGASVVFAPLEQETARADEAPEPAPRQPSLAEELGL